MEAVFDCEGCGLRIYSIGHDATVPRHRLCAICEFLCAHVAADEIMEMRRSIEPGGWLSERQQRRPSATNPAGTAA